MLLRCRQDVDRERVTIPTPVIVYSPTNACILGMFGDTGYVTFVPF
jgi:hypothetical protein